jgi:hypothetical protein
MTALLFAMLAPAQAQDALQVAQYSCEQTNPMQYTDFHLRFRAIVTSDPDRPYAATLYDLETDSVRIRSRDLQERAAFRIEGWDAYSLGRDEVGTIYVLRVPRQADLGEQFDAQMVQVFGDGRAQWVNEFACVVAP